MTHTDPTPEIRQLDSDRTQTDLTHARLETQTRQPHCDLNLNGPDPI